MKAPRNGTELLAWAKSRVGTAYETGMCAQWVIRDGLKIPPPWKWGGNGKPWAINYALAAKKVVRTTDAAKIPKYAIGILTGGNSRAGHIFVSDGSGYCYSTDTPKDGKIGRVKITDLCKRWDLTVWGYVLIDGAGYDVSPPAPKPAKKTAPWFTFIGWNLAASDAVHGQASWDTRAKKGGVIEQALKYYDRDMLLLVEAETNGKQGAEFAALLDRLGYKIAVGHEQRLVAVRKSWQVLHYKKVTLTERGPANDDKQAAMAHVVPAGSGKDTGAWIGVSGHFEYRDGAAYDKARVAQAKEERRIAEAFADACGVPHHRILYYNDENSAAQVSDQVFGSTYPDLHDHVTYGNPKLGTLCGWDGKAKNSTYRPDKIHVHKDRPMIGASTSPSTVAKKISDHLPIVGTTAKYL